jgi:hypothetical protein
MANVKIYEGANGSYIDDGENLRFIRPEEEGFIKTGFYVKPLPLLRTKDHEIKIWKEFLKRQINK